MLLISGMKSKIIKPQKTSFEDLEKILLNAPKLTAEQSRYGTIITARTSTGNAKMYHNWYDTKGYDTKDKKIFDGRFSVDGTKKGKELAEYYGKYKDITFKTLWEKLREKYNAQYKKR